MNLSSQMQDWGIPQPSADYFGMSGSADGTGLAGLGGGSNPAGDFTMMQKMFGGAQADGTATNGMVMPALNTLTGVAGLWMGKQQLDLAQKSLRENRRQFGLNFNSQAKNYNSRIEDRQRARNASNSTGVYESTDSYLQKNKISEVG
jgi:hypothetical protein